MNEIAIAIVIDIVILQLNIASITAGILTYMRYRKDSLKYFILLIGSLQALLTGMLVESCEKYAGHGNPVFFWAAKGFDIAGTAGLLFALSNFSFYIAGRKPGKTSGILSVVFAVGFLLDALFLSITKWAVFIMLNQVICAAILIGSYGLIGAAFRNIPAKARIRAVGYLMGILFIFVRYIISGPLPGESLLFQEGWMGGILSFPVFILMTSLGGLLLMKTYFAVPFFINPESGKLSDYFLEKFNITGREAEIIMELHQGKSYKEIAAELSIAYKTVDAHIQNIYSKTGVNNRKQLVNLIESSSI